MLPPFPRYVMGNQSLIFQSPAKRVHKETQICSGSAISAYLYCANKKLVCPSNTQHVFHLFFVNMLAFYQSQLWKPIHFMKGENQGNIRKADWWTVNSDLFSTIIILLDWKQLAGAMESRSKVVVNLIDSFVDGNGETNAVLTEIVNRVEFADKDIAQNPQGSSWLGNIQSQKSRQTQGFVGGSIDELCQSNQLSKSFVNEHNYKKIPGWCNQFLPGRTVCHRSWKSWRVNWEFRCSQPNRKK